MLSHGTVAEGRQRGLRRFAWVESAEPRLPTCSMCQVQIPFSTAHGGCNMASMVSSSGWQQLSGELTLLGVSKVADIVDAEDAVLLSSSIQESRPILISIVKFFEFFTKQIELHFSNYI